VISVCRLRARVLRGAAHGPSWPLLSPLRSRWPELGVELSREKSNREKSIKPYPSSIRFPGFSDAF
jgi:hypothetical protein